MVDIFQSVIAGWTQLGFFQYLFPFLLALAIIYGVLMWALKDRMPKSAVALVSLILSFFVMLFAGSNPGIVSFLTNLSGSALIVLSGILFIIIMAGLLGFRVEDVFEKGKRPMWVLILAVIVIVVVIVFGAGGGMFVSIPGWAYSADLWTIVFFIVILAIVLLLMGQESGGKEEKKG